MRELVLISLVASLVACGGKSAPAESTPPAPAPSEAPPPPTELVLEVPAEPPHEVPPPEPSEPSRNTTGVPACDEYLDMFDLLIDTCADKLGPAADALRQAQQASREAFGDWAHLDPASREAAGDAAASACVQAKDALRQAGQALGCAL